MIQGEAARDAGRAALEAAVNEHDQRNDREVGDCERDGEHDDRAGSETEFKKRHDIAPLGSG